MVRRVRLRLGALLLTDLAGSAMQVVLAVRGIGAPRGIAGSAAISAVGVLCASPALVRVERTLDRRDARHALRVVRFGIAFHSAACVALLLAAPLRRSDRVIVGTVLIAGDGISLGYIRMLEHVAR